MVDSTAKEQGGGDASGEIWPNGMKIPVLGVTGEKYSGKTLFVSSIDPKRTLMIDLEKSSETYSIPFAERFDIYDALLDDGSVAQPKPVDVFRVFKKRLEVIKPGEFSVIAVDPINDIEAGLTDYVLQNPGEFGRTSAQYAKGGGLLWGDVKAFWKLTIGMLTAKCQTFAFTTHMGFVWKGATPTSQRKAKGKDTLFELASVYLQLERKPAQNGTIKEIPAAIVLKSRLANSMFSDSGELTHQSILPPRIESASPTTIRKYIIVPPDFKKLKVGEKAQVEEMSEDDRLVIKSQIASDEAATEAGKMSRLELMAANAKATSRRRAATVGDAPKDTLQQPAASPQSKAQMDPVDDPKASDAEAVSATAEKDSPAETGSGTAAAEDSQAMSREDKIQLIESQRLQLKITQDQMDAIVARRGVKTIGEVSDDQLEVIRQKFWDLLTQREMGKR